MEVDHTVEVGRDRRAEAMLRFMRLAEGIEAFDGKTVPEVFANEESVRNMIGELSDSEYVDLISGINGILRGKKSDDWQIDGHDVLLSGFTGVDIPPRFEDKKILLNESWGAVQRMNGQGRPLKDIALLLSSTVNAVHAFNDGNGRTSRMVYTLLSKENWEQREEQLRKALSEYGRNETEDIDPSRIFVEIEDLIISKTGANDRSVNVNNVTNLFHDKPSSEFEFVKGVDKFDENSYRLACRDDSRTLFAAIFNHFKTKDEGYFQEFRRRYGKREVILADKVAAELSPEALHEIMEEYWRIKRERVEILVDCIENPNKYEVKKGDDAVTFKELLENRIAESLDNQ